MKIRISAFSVQALALGALLTVLPLSFAADTSDKKTTAKDVSRKVDETGQAIRNYTVAQRDEAIKNEWDRMDQAARKKARAALNALRRERNETGEWYGGLKHSSAEAWEQVKAGFVKSYEALRESFAKAGKAF